ncbi:MAG: tetratricopeptide repeat protein, partial [Blastocatellia bacterium]
MKKRSQLKPGSESGNLIYVNNHIFLGRVEEQKQFRNVLGEVLNTTGEELPWVALLYGDGGMGKTTLAARFRDIAQGEEPFAGAFETLAIDWEELRRRHVSLQADRESIAPEAVFDALHAAIPQDWKRHFNKYREAVKLRAEAEKKASDALSVAGERDSLSELRGMGAGAMAKLVRQGAPAIGETGEKAVKILSELGIKVAEGQARNVINALNTRLRARLKPEQFDIFLNPQERLARAMADGLKKLTEDGLVLSGKPLIVTLDTYEIVDRADVWMRVVMRHAGPRVLWIVCGRNNLRESRAFGAEYFKGYREEWPRRLLDYNMPQLALDDVRTWFASEAPEHPLNEAEAEAISRATRGIPLAIREAAEMRQRGVPVEEIVGDINDATPTKEIVTRMTERYLLHAINNEADRRALYALALARGDRDRLRAMLRPDDDQPFDLDARLSDLARDYASVHLDDNQLHNAPALFFRERLKRSRDEDWAQTLNRRAVETLRARLRKLEAELPRLEDRCDDEDWTQTAIALTDHLFWLDETEAWRWLAPRFVESLAYGGELREGLIDTARGWKERLSRGGQKRLRLFSEGVVFWSLVEDQAAMLGELDRLAKLGWMKESEEDACELERRAILDWQRGEMLCERGKYTEALASYERAEHGLPPGGEALRKRLADSLNSLAAKFIWPNDKRIVYLPESERILSKVVEWLPDKGNAWYNLGATFQFARKLDQAIAAYNRAIELDPKDAYPHNGLGAVYRDLGRSEEAMAAYSRAIELDPKFAIPHNNLGNVYRDLSRNDEAITAYGRAIELDLKFAYPHNGLGNVYRDLGRREEAMAAYGRAIELDPKFADPHNNLGNVYRDLGRHEEAMAAYGRAIKLDPKDTYSHNGLGNVYHDLGRHEEAMAAYGRAIELDPKFADPHNNLGNVYRDLGRREEAMAAYGRAIELDPKFAAPHYGLGNVYRDLGQREEAMAAYGRAIELDPKFAYPHNNLGVVYNNLSRHEEAIAAYGRAIELDPKYAYPHYGLGNVYYALGRYEEAINAFGRAIELDPKLAAPHNNLGNVYHDLGRHEEAMAAYGRAIELDPKFADPHNGLGKVYYALGRREEAMAAFGRAIELDPKLAAPHNNLGAVYSDLSRREEAIAAYGRAIELDPKFAAPHNGLGKVYYALGRREEAMAAFG